MRFCLTLLAISGALSAQVGFVIGGATEITQLINRAELALIQAKQIQMYLDQIKHTTKLGKIPVSDINAHMAQFEQAIRLGQSISATMADADQIFRQRYPGYGQLKRRFPDEYRVWSGTAFDTLQAVLRAASRQRVNMASESAVIYDLREASKSAEGRMQVQQTQVAVAGETLNQLMKLRELMMADISAKTMYQAMQMQKDAAAAAVGEHWFTHIDQADAGNRKVGLRQ
jgi:P-type conjugative transfer protein TrbJ